MVPHVLCTAVEYHIPVVWVVWNNFGWVSIRDIQLGMFGGRELGTMFYHGANNTPYNPDFAGWAKAAGVAGSPSPSRRTSRARWSTRSIGNKPFLLDVHVDAEIRPPATGPGSCRRPHQGAGVRQSLWRPVRRRTGLRRRNEVQGE